MLHIAVCARARTHTHTHTHAHTHTRKSGTELTHDHNTPVIAQSVVERFVKVLARARDSQSH
jgi:hypothetical protein